MSRQLHIVGVQFSSFTRAVQFCCEEINLPYTLGPIVDGQEYALRSDTLKTIHPFSKIPVLIDDGRTLYETQAICRYLDNNYNQSRLQPADPWRAALVDQWCAAITAYVDKVIVRNYLLEFLSPKGENGAVRQDVVTAAMPEIINVVGILEAQLGERNYVVGDSFTLADILLAPVVIYLVNGPHNTDLVQPHSALRRYAAAILARPAAKNVFIPVVR